MHGKYKPPGGTVPAGAVATAVRRALALSSGWRDPTGGSSATSPRNPRRTWHSTRSSPGKSTRRQTRLSRAEVIDVLAGLFRRRYSLTPDTVTGGELRAARDLALGKFASSEWTARVP